MLLRQDAKLDEPDKLLGKKDGIKHELEQRRVRDWRSRPSKPKELLLKMENTHSTKTDYALNPKSPNNPAKSTIQQFQDLLNS